MLASLVLICLWLGINEATSALSSLPIGDSSTLVYMHDVNINNTHFQSSEEDLFMRGVMSAFTVTAVSEVGDRTFFLALVLALAHPPSRVLCGALSALALMTMLSACMGLVFSFLSSLWVHYLSTFLFVAFGLKMLREGCIMSSSAGKEEFEDVQKTVEKKMIEKNKGNLDAETGHLSPSNFGIRVMVEAFTMTFLSEWGDRSQIATVILAAKHNVFSVILGSVLGHTMCTLGAVIGGKLIADWISVRTVTLIGGVLFLLFAVSSLIGALEETFEDSIL